MAGTSLLALIDDIATLLDDVAVLSKVAVKKTAGVLGDDLALNAQQVSGVQADRELPVVWAVAKGSMLNKAILVPVALLISAIFPAAITPLLMIGGAFLCYEGFEKLAHRFLHSKAEDLQEHRALVQAVADPQVDLLQFERDKIRGAIRTDFILSAEIIVITLGTVSTQPFGKQVAVLVAIALLMTVGVYGLVAGIVKLDDAGLHLSRQPGTLQQKLGALILRAAPILMKFLSIAGTAAMFMVGGSILAHGIPAVHHLIEQWSQAAALALPAIGGAVALLVAILLEALLGILAGALVLLLVIGVRRLLGKPAAAH